MAQVNHPTKAIRWLPTLDTWAVILGLVLAVLVRLGVLKHVAW